MSYNTGARIVRDGFLFYLDAANSKSYVSGSSVWNDLSGNKNSGSIYNSPVFNTYNGGSLTFDGTDDDINVAASVIYTEITTNVWVRLSSSAISGSQYIACASLINTFRLGVSFGYKAYLGITSSSIVLDIPTSNTPSLQTGSWYMLTGVSGPSSLSLYVNGNLAASTSSNFPFGGADIFVIGRSFRQGRGVFNGDMAQIQVYNRALSASEILQNYNATKKRFGL